MLFNKETFLCLGNTEEDGFLPTEHSVDPRHHGKGVQDETSEHKGHEKEEDKAWRPYNKRLVYGVDDNPPLHIALICAFQVRTFRGLQKSCLSFGEECIALQLTVQVKTAAKLIQQLFNIEQAD